jgi:quinol monooxygenase YgiN
MRHATNGLTRRGFCAAGAGLATFGFNRLASAADGPSADKMVTQIAKFKLNKAKESEALDVLRELCASVEANEPDVLIYLCHRSAKKPDELVFFEVYRDAATLKAHMKTPHFKKLAKSIGTLFFLPIEVTVLDRIGGFARGSGKNA